MWVTEKAQTWTPASEPVSLKISPSKHISLAVSTLNPGPGGPTLRLCRELCFSLLRKKTADCVWARVRGLDDGRKPAGSVAGGKLKERQMSETHKITLSYCCTELRAWTHLNVTVGLLAVKYSDCTFFIYFFKYLKVVSFYVWEKYK